MSLIPQVLEDNGIKVPAKRDFHLNDREELIKMCEEKGFKNTICWN